MEVEEIGNNEAAKNSSDTGVESEHNNNSTGTEFLKISEIKDAKYFTIMLDSTPDIGH